MPKPKDITGQKFGRLTAIRRDHQVHRRWAWLCRCDCGKSVVLDINRLTTGNTKSCGCYRDSRIGLNNRTHGNSKSPTHYSWKGMRQRCLNPNNPSWPHYGGRGIKVCERWNSFENFLSDMGERPDGLTLERLDNDVDYTPSNCVWATRTTQLRNQQKTIRIHWNGKTRCLSEWARHFGISNQSLHRRFRNGETPPDLFRPPRGCNRA